MKKKMIYILAAALSLSVVQPLQVKSVIQAEVEMTKQDEVFDFYGGEKYQGQKQLSLMQHKVRGFLLRIIELPIT